MGGGIMSNSPKKGEPYNALFHESGKALWLWNLVGNKPILSVCSLIPSNEYLVYHFPYRLYH